MLGNPMRCGMCSSWVWTGSVRWNGIANSERRVMQHARRSGRVQEFLSVFGEEVQRSFLRPRRDIMSSRGETRSGLGPVASEFPIRPDLRGYPPSGRRLALEPATPQGAPAVEPSRSTGRRSICLPLHRKCRQSVYSIKCVQLFPIAIKSSSSLPLNLPDQYRSKGLMFHNAIRPMPRFP